MDMSKDQDTEDMMNPENKVDPENPDEDSATEDVDTKEDLGTEEEVDTEKSVGTEKGGDVENDSDIENNVGAKEEDTEKKAIDTGKKKIRKLKLLKNRVTLLHISREIKGEEKLKKMRNCVAEKDNSLTVEGLSDLTSLKLISLMEDKGMISMKDCTFLKTTLEKMDLNELKNDLSQKWKDEEEEVSLDEDSDIEIPEEDEGLDEKELNQKMKDFIAYSMEDSDWKWIARDNLPPETETQITHDHKPLYDRAYCVVRELINQGKVRKWSEMKNILKNVNKGIINKFTHKFSSKQSAPGKVDGENEEVNQGDVVSDEELRKVSIGYDWKRLARNLEIEDEVVDNINLNDDFASLEDKCREVFKQYHRKNERIRREFLNNIFEDIGKHNQKIESRGTKEENAKESIENSE